MQDNDRAALWEAAAAEGAESAFGDKMAGFIGDHPLTYENVRRAAKMAGFTWGDMASKIASHFSSATDSAVATSGDVMKPKPKPKRRVRK
jgi:hypothetical protein